MSSSNRNQSNADSQGRVQKHIDFSYKNIESQQTPNRKKQTDISKEQMKEIGLSTREFEEMETIY
tara:strand:+ start:296 stop:490 length:195 start_codon:yes stop_codon:yes gene_type:complete